VRALFDALRRYQSTFEVCYQPTSCHSKALTGLAVGRRRVTTPAIDASSGNTLSRGLRRSGARVVEPSQRVCQRALSAAHRAASGARPAPPPAPHARASGLWQAPMPSLCKAPVDAAEVRWCRAHQREQQRGGSRPAASALSSPGQPYRAAWTDRSQGLWRAVGQVTSDEPVLSTWCRVHRT